jgi:hypothetical protein
MNTSIFASLAFVDPRCPLNVTLLPDKNVPCLSTTIVMNKGITRFELLPGNFFPVCLVVVEVPCHKRMLVDIDSDRAGYLPDFRHKTGTVGAILTTVATVRTPGKACIY